MSVDRGHGSREIATHLTLQATAQNPVDEQVRCAVEFTCPGHDNSTLGREITPGGRGISSQCFRIDKGQNRHHDALLRRKPRYHIAITTVVSCATDHLPALRIRIPLPRLPHCSSTSTCHQGVTGNAVVLDCRAICFTHGGD